MRRRLSRYHSERFIMPDARSTHYLLISWCAYLSQSAIDARPMEQRGLLDEQISSWFTGDQSRGDAISNPALREPHLQRRIPSSLVVSALPIQTTTIVPTLQSHWTLTDPSNQTPTISPSTTPNDTTPDMPNLYPNNAFNMTFYIVVAVISSALFVWIAYACWYLRKRELQAEQATREVEAAFVNGESPTDLDTRGHNPRQKEWKAAIDQLFPVRTFSSENIGHSKMEERKISNIGETFEITDIVEEEKSRCDKNSEDKLGDKDGKNAIDISLNPLETMETKIAAPLVRMKSGFSLSPTQAPVPSTVYQRDDDPCTICLDHWLEGDLIRYLPCSHQFHVRCLDPWFLRIEAVCPNCKRDYKPALRGFFFFFFWLSHLFVI